MKKQYLCPQTEGCEINAMVSLLVGSTVDTKMTVSSNALQGQINQGNPNAAM